MTTALLNPSRSHELALLKCLERSEFQENIINQIHLIKDTDQYVSCYNLSDNYFIPYTKTIHTSRQVER